jgi:benzoyl-CoA reductase subunit C
MLAIDGMLAHFQSRAGLPLTSWRRRFPNHSPIGYMNAYVPLELLHAAGYCPVFLSATDSCGSPIQAHLPGFTCWTTRSVLDQALAGELDGWAGVVFGQTCDALQALADLWPRAVPQVPGLFFAMPHHLATPAARPYLIAELRKLRCQLEELSGHKISDEALSNSITLGNEMRTLMSLLYSAADCLHPVTLHDILSCSLLMPWEQSGPLLQQLFTVLPDSGHDQAPRFVVVGPEIASFNLYVVIGETGAVVVADLLDLGQRRHHYLISEKGDPVEALADQMLALLPTPTKHHPDHSRAEFLLETVRSSRADGVVFARQKFCDPYGFDYVDLKSALDGAGVPHLLVELEQTPNLGQMRTRVQAFVEMMEG